MNLARIATIGVVILGIYLCGVSSNAQTEPMSLSIEIDKPSVKLGTDIQVKVLLKNNTDHAISGSEVSMEGYGGFQYKVNVEREDHTAVARKYVEKFRRHEIGPRPGTGSVIFIHIQPGETDKDIVYVNNRYEFDKPGKYLVQVEYDLPKDLGGGVIKSNIITVTVIP
jgi:hypothetical protein